MSVDTAPGTATRTAAEVIERDRAGAVPARELAALDASGLLGITVPRAHGGADLPAAVLAEVVRVIAATDPAAWKYHHVGSYLLNDTLPPNHGQL